MAPYDQIVLLGDSLFEWAAPVENGYSFHAALQGLRLIVCLRRLDVVNRGFGGWNTENVLRFLPDLFPVHEPLESHGRVKYLLVLLGANDACLPHADPPQGIPLDEYAANLKKIITHDNVVRHKPQVLLITPPPLDETRIWEFTDEQPDGSRKLTRTAANSAAYSEAARRVAAEVPGTLLVDLQKGLMDKALALTPDLSEKDYDENGKPLLGYLKGRRGGLGELLPDGLHMSATAYRVLYDLVKPHLGPFIGTPYVFPDWKDLAAERKNNGGKPGFDTFQ
ncbi:SGNH hydrolase-type esterase domain-containing protein [Xylariales sp. PMI_506]|nr:SGNH hydrolase-type esterase domain-containing protein [Xylariales sp. PMI_506]